MAEVFIWEKSNVKVSLNVASVGADEISVNQLIFRSGLKVAIFYFDSEVKIHKALLTQQVPPDWLLSNLQQKLELLIGEVQKETSAAAKEAKNGAVEAFRAERAKLQHALRRQIVKTHGGALNATFFGLTTIGAAAMSATASLELLELQAEGSTLSNAAILTLSATAEAKIGVAGVTESFKWGLVVELDANANITLAPSFQLPRFPMLPPLDFHVRPINWPNFDLDVTIGPILRLLQFNLPLPNLGITVDPAPQLALSVSGQDLKVQTVAPANGEVKVNGTPIARFTNFTLLLDNRQLVLGGEIVGSGLAVYQMGAQSFGSPAAMPITIDVPSSELDVRSAGMVNLATGRVDFTITALLRVPRVVIRAKKDPSLQLVLSLEYKMEIAGSVSGSLQRLEVIDPYPMQLISALGDAIGDGISRLIALIELPPTPTAPSLPNLDGLLERLSKLVAAAIEYFAEMAGAAARALIGVAEAAANLLAKVLQLIRKGASAVVSHLSIEVRIDSNTMALRQIIISPVRQGVPGNSKIEIETVGLFLGLPPSLSPALIIDLTGKPLVALAVGPANNDTVTLSTDLWLQRDGAGVESIRDADAKSGARPQTRLIEIKVEPKANVLALMAFSDGKASFLRKLESAAKDETFAISGKHVTVRQVATELRLLDIDWNTELGSVTAAVDKDRLLPFLSTPKAAQGSALDDLLGQSIKVRDVNTVPSNAGTVAIQVPVEITLNTLKTDTVLTIDLSLSDFTARLKGPEGLSIRGRKDKTFDLFGMTLTITPKDASAIEFEQFRLDFTGGDVRMLLSPEATAELTYRKIASSGRGLVFIVDSFAVARNVFDIEARVNPLEPVTIAGIDRSFSFKEGGLSVKRGKIQAFSIRGSGSLPPALVGEANADVRIAFSQGANDELEVQSAEAELDKSNNPLVCHGTRFKLTITKLGFEYRNFGREGGYQFFFTLTGSAEFSPDSGEMSSTMLKYLPDLKITLDKAPLTSDARLLTRAIEFQIAVEPKKKINFFELFNFELRGVGFHPSSPLFGNKPALSISGQINFIEAGDIVSPKFDFHKLWIAPPKSGQSLPQVRFDGLGVGLRIGGAATVEGTAIAVDDKLPSIYAPDTLPANVTARGFLASGRLSVKGWASMSAAMGFLELQEEGKSPRQAFFLYGQANELSVSIPTPIGNIYLREVGFGFGFRFTLAGLARADRVTNPNMLVEVLDDVSRYQGSLDKVTAWQPEPRGDNVTLAMRAMFSFASASQDGNGLKDAEKDLSNPVLFDVAAALRSDLTFLMTVRAWVAVNYWTWARGNGQNDFGDKPMLRGYLYISAPRQEFLARMISDPKGYIGNTPPLPEPLKQALQSVYWSSTLYIRPGLFHQEFGWPYELGFDFKKGDNIAIQCRGGMITRIEDFSLLYGLAFKADGYAQFGGQIGGRSFGASVTARADFSIEAKFIAYLSLKRFNDTFFYGSLAFSVTLEFGVRVWLEFSIGIKDIHLEVSFSQRLCVTVALELAVTPNDLGGRGAATVSVSAFGRTIGIGVALGFNDGLLREARSRVERFLALGLEASLPDPAQGLAPPQPAKNTADANQQIEKQAELAEIIRIPTTAPPAPGILPDISGEPIGVPRFWALVFETPAKPGTFLLTFIPRDRTEVSPAAIDKLHNTDSTFFVPPSTAGLVKDYVIENWPAGTRYLLTTGPVVPAAGTVDARVDYNTIIYQRDSQSITLGQYLKECFVNERKAGALTGNLQQPPAEKIISQRELLPEDPVARARELREAGTNQVDLAPSRQAYRDVEERRSATIAALAESAAKLAGSATLGAAGLEWPARPGEGIDVRDFALTFEVSDLGALFQLDEANPPNSKPPHALFQIKSKTSPDVAPVVESKVHLFNPPQRNFENSNPILSKSRAWLEDGRVKLDWDLEPAWIQSVGLWDDPEFHLKHYLIQRTILNDAGVVAEANIEGATAFTTKAAAPMKAKEDPSQPKIVCWAPLRPVAQFVDDFAHVPKAYRDAILHAGDAPWDVADKLANGLRVLYTIIPVDISGKTGVPTPLVFVPTAALEPAKPLAKAELVLHYTGQHLPEPKDTAQVSLSLRIDDMLFRDGAKQQGPFDKARYRLKIRPERGYPSGLYGADSLTQARQRPSPADLERFDQGDCIFELELQGQPSRSSFEAIEVEPTNPTGPWFKLVPPTDTSGGDAPGLEKTPTLAELKAALGIIAGSGLYPVRIAARGVPTLPPKGPTSTLDRIITPWCVVDTILRVGPKKPLPNGGSAYPVDANVEVFEHPRHVNFEPLHFEDLDGEAGRLLTYHPHVGADLGDLLSAQKNGVIKPAGDVHCGVQRQRDPSRRIGTRIRWNARPGAVYDGASGQPNLDRDLIGGFEVFEIDTSSVVEDGPNPDLVSYSRYAARVQVLPTALARLDPAQIEDYGSVEAYYPSDTLRTSGADRVRGLNDGNPRQRSAAWYSLAESLPAFPKTLLRRSLAINHEEAALTALFAVGRPKEIKISLVNWPKAGAVEAKDISLGHFGAGGFSAATDGVFVAPGGAEWTPGSLGLLLRQLAWECAGDAAVDELFASRPEAFADVRLQLSGTYKHTGGFSVPTGSIELPIDLIPALHAVLGDVLDDLRWSNAAEATAYRRYSLVLDGAPQTKADSINAFMDERPAERDPHGWAILRTLGLSTGLRLYDTERGEFLAPRAALTHIAASMRRIQDRYRQHPIGAPIVEVISRPSGLMTIASFDEANPYLAEREIADLIDNETLALSQISLRPVPDRFENPAAAAVQYFVLSRGPLAVGDPAPTSVTFDPAQLKHDKFLFLAEVIEVSRGLAGGWPTALAADEAIVTTVWVDGSPRVTPLTLDVAGLQENDAIALLRVTSVKKDKLDPAAAINAVHLLAQMIGQTAADTEFVFEPIAQPAVSLPSTISNRFPEPFERFGPVSGRRWAALMFGVKQKEVAVNPSAESHEDPRTRELYLRFAAHARRRFSKDWPDETLDAGSAFANRLLPWLSRFLSQGVATAPQPDKVPFALATLTQGDPWRVEPQVDGSMELLLLHKDRFARRRRYVVRPFGRYESFVTAADPTLLGQPSLMTLPRPFADRSFDEHSIDITIPRTEPLAAPVIVSARRLDIGPRQVGRASEFVLSRHEEELVSEGNIDVSDGLQFEHVGVGFWREFASAAWATAAWKLVDSHPIDLLPERVEDHSPSPPALSFPTSTSFDNDCEIVSPGSPLQLRRPESLPARHIDGWRGLTVVRTQCVPHFYRLHAVAYASAGVIVSAPSAAVVPEGFYLNQVPWDGSLLGTHTIEPVWQIERGAYRLKVVLTVPLVRFIDGMPEEDRQLWKEANSLPEVFSLPDPAVSYVIAFASVINGAEILALATELELMALPPPAANPRARFAITSSGTRLQPWKPNPAPDQLLSIAPSIMGNDKRNWIVDLPTRLVGPPGRKVALTPTAADWPTLLMQFEVPDSGGLWRQWRDVAPVARAVVTIKHPTPAGGSAIDWSAFMATLTVWRDAFASYNQDTEEIVGFISQFTTGMDADKWRKLAGSSDDDSISEPIGQPWRAGLPSLTAWTTPAGDVGSRDALISIACSDWAIPAIERTGLNASLIVESTLSSNDIHLAAGFAPSGLRTAYSSEIASHERLLLDKTWAADFAKVEVPADWPAVDPTLWAEWRDSAPIDKAELTIIKPVDTVAAWTAFMVGIKQWRDAYVDYGVDAAAVRALLEPFTTDMDIAKWNTLTHGAAGDYTEAIAGLWRAGLPILHDWSDSAGDSGTRDLVVQVRTSDWWMRGIASADVAHRRAVQRVLLSLYVRTVQGVDPADVLRPQYIKALRDLDVMMRIALDEQPFAGVLPHSTIIPQQLQAKANNLADSGDISPPVDLIRLVMIEASPTAANPTPLWSRDELYDLIAALEAYAVNIGTTTVAIGAAAAISALGELEDRGKGQAELPLPHHALRPGHPVNDRLGLLDAVADVTVKRSASSNALILRRPLVATELAQLAALDAQLGEFIDTAARDQLFGPSRKPVVKILHGLTDPILTVFERS